MIKRLFFDIGSTLVDESACDAFRFEHMLSQENAPAGDVLAQKMCGYARNGRHPYKTALAEFSLTKCPWPVQLERLYPGVGAMLERLRKKYRLGIIANQLPGAEDRLKAYGIHGYFDVIVSSAEAGCEKPDAQIFRMGLERVRCAPEEAVMIGDRPDNDIFPAAALGMGTIRVRQGIFREWDAPGDTVFHICDITDILL